VAESGRKYHDLLGRLSTWTKNVTESHLYAYAIPHPMVPKTLIQSVLIASAVATIIASGLSLDPSDGSEDSFVIDGIGYRIVSDYGVEAYQFDEFLTEAIFPPTVVHNGEIYAVVSLYSTTVHNFEYIYIPDTVTKINNFYDELEFAQRIDISAFNPVFASQDNVVYSADMSQLLKYPNIKSDPTFIVPDFVSSIGERAFDYNLNIQEIWIGPKVQEIGDEAFLGCQNLKRINPTEIGNTLPEGLLTIGAMAFEDTGLEDINLPDSLRLIGNYAFFNSKIRSLSIGFNTTSIGDSAFSNCTNLESISCGSPQFYAENGVLFKNDFVTDSLVMLTYAAGKKELSYTIPEEVTDIKSHAFYGNNYLEELTFPSSMLLVPAYSIQYAEALKRVELSNSILSVEDYAFVGCRSLEEIVWGANVVYIGYAAFDSTHLCELVIPDSITSIDNSAFCRNYDLTHVYIPASVQYMGRGVFSEDVSIANIEFGGSAPRMSRDCLSIIEDGSDPFVLNLTVQKGFVLPDSALGDYTIANIYVEGLLPYPYENLLVALLCLAIVILILRFVKDV